MDAELLADLRALGIEKRPEGLPVGLEMICSSVEQSAVEVGRLEKAGSSNSPEYISVLEALKLTVGELKKYRTGDRWDTEKFLQDHPQEPYPCSGFTCQPWHGIGVPVFLDNSGAFFYHAPSDDGKGYEARTGVVGVHRDPRDSDAHETQERIIGSRLYRPTETHRRPSTIDPFGSGKGVMIEDTEGVPMGPEHEMKYSLGSRFGAGDKPVIVSGDDPDSVRNLDDVRKYLLDPSNKPPKTGDSGDKPSDGGKYSPPHVDCETLRRMVKDIMVDNPPDIGDSNEKPPGTAETE